MSTPRPTPAPSADDGEIASLREQLAGERLAREQSELAQRRLTFVIQATTILAADKPDPTVRLKTLAQLCVPDLADWAIVDLAGPPVTRVAVAHMDPTKGTLAAELRERAPSLAAKGGPGPGNVLATGQSELVPEIPWLSPANGAAPQLQDDFLRELHALGARSYMVVPLVLAGRPAGAVTFVAAESNRRYGSDDLAIAQDLCRRAALAVDNANLFQAENALRAQAEAAARARDDIVAVVSHDLRNPLGSIVTAGSLLFRMASRDGAEPRMQKHVETIQRNAHRMIRMIGDLLDISAIEAGNLTVTPKPEPLEELLREALAEGASQADTKGVKLAALSLTGDLSEAKVLADRERLLQVLSNLLGNAVKFTPEGGSISLLAVPAGTSVCVSVADTGIGIAPENLGKIFDRGWQATSRPGRSGIGLGLSIAKGIVHAHGGQIWAESAPGQGTTVHFTLPLGR
jgi:signal transduction histidine kinase